MTNIRKNQSNTLIAKKVLKLLKDYNLNIDEIRCYDCNSKLFNLVKESDSNVVECKCKRCKSLNYYEAN